MSKNIKRATN